MKHARFTEDLEQETVVAMPIGDVGYVVPWALYVVDEHLYINGAYTIHENKGGTVQLKIKRTKNGVRVWRDTLGDHRLSSSSDWTSKALPVEWK